VCVAASIVARGCAGRCSFVIERKTQFPAPLPVSAAIFQHTRNNNNKKLKKYQKIFYSIFFKMKPHLCPYTQTPLYKICTCVIRSLY
jgi:hypothetical protein